MADGKVNTKARDIKIECTDSKKKNYMTFLIKNLFCTFTLKI